MQGFERCHGKTGRTATTLVLVGMCCELLLIRFPCDFVLQPTMPSMPTSARSQRRLSPHVVLHARGGGTSVSCKDVKESIMTRRANLEKDLKNLKKYDKTDQGHAKELDQKIPALEKDLDRWDRLGCGPDSDVEQVRDDIYEAKELLEEKRHFKMVRVSDDTEFIMTTSQVALILGIGVLVVSFLGVFGPSILEALLLRAGFRVIGLSCL